MAEPPHPRKPGAVPASWVPYLPPGYVPDEIITDVVEPGSAADTPFPTPDASDQPPRPKARPDATSRYPAAPQDSFGGNEKDEGPSTSRTFNWRRVLVLGGLILAVLIGVAVIDRSYTSPDDPVESPTFTTTGPSAATTTVSGSVPVNSDIVRVTSTVITMGNTATSGSSPVDAGGEWQAVGAAPCVLYDMTPYAVGNDFYFVGRTSSANGPVPVCRFETASGTWTNLSDTPAVPDYDTRSVTVLGDTGLVVMMSHRDLFGGLEEPSIILFYDIGADAWAELPPLTCPPAGTPGNDIQVVPDGNAFYAVCISGLTGNTDLGIWRYEPAMGSWSTPVTGPDAAFADYGDFGDVHRYAGMFGDKLVLGVIGGNQAGSGQIVEWADLQTNALEVLDLSHTVVTGRSGGQFLFSSRCGPSVWSGSCLWLSDTSRPNFSNSSVFDVFDFVAGDIVYYGFFRSDSCSEEFGCGNARAIPGGRIVIGLDVIDPVRESFTRIPDPPQLLPAEAIAFSATTAMTCATRACFTYTFR